MRLEGTKVPCMRYGERGSLDFECEVDRNQVEFQCTPTWKACMCTYTHPIPNPLRHAMPGASLRPESYK